MLDTTRYAYAPLAVVLAFALTVLASAAEAERMFEGRVDGRLAGEPVWVGLFVGDSTAGRWTRVDGERFEVAVPVDGRSSLVIISKDRVAKKILVVGERMALRLQPGHALAGTVRSEDGSPLSDVTITVAARYGGLEVPPFATPRWRTDRAGAFVIEGLDSGSHTLAFARDGVPVLLQEVSIPSDIERSQVDVALGPGHFISGRVVDSEGEPVADATVETEWWIVARTKTAEDGSFHLGPFRRSTRVRVRADSPTLGASLPHEVHAPSQDLVLELRRYMLLGRVVRARTGEPVPSFRLMILGRTRWRTIETEDGFFQMPLKDPTYPTYAVVISAEGHPPWLSTLVPSESDNYDLGLIALARARSISGRVVDALTGTPIEGANVRLGSREHDDVVWRSATSKLEGAKTDADGGFALSALPWEEAPITTLAPGYQRKTVYLPPEVRHLDIALDPAHVPSATISGSITLPDGSPVAGVVALASPNSEYHTFHNKNATTDENGAFRLAGLQDGTYDLIAASEAGVVPSRAVVVADGESLEDVRLVVKDSPRVHLSLTGLRSEASVSICDQNQRRIYEWQFGNGTHAIRGLPGESTVAARTSQGNSSRRLDRRLHLEEGQEANITFDFAHDSRLSGTVTTGGQPLGKIYLQVVPANPSMPVGSTLTTRQGRYDVWGLSPGRHIVRAGAGHSFEVDMAERTALDIELPPISVSGSVRSARSESPIGFAYVLLRGSDGYGKGALTATDGTFHFHGLSAGEYVIRASQRGFEDRSQRLLVGGEESVVLELEQSASGEDSAGRG